MRSDWLEQQEANTCFTQQYRDKKDLTRRWSETGTNPCVEHVGHGDGCVGTSSLERSMRNKTNPRRRNHSWRTRGHRTALGFLRPNAHISSQRPSRRCGDQDTIKGRSPTMRHRLSQSHRVNLDWFVDWIQSAPSSKSLTFSPKGSFTREHWTQITHLLIFDDTTCALTQPFFGGVFFVIATRRQDVELRVRQELSQKMQQSNKGRCAISVRTLFTQQVRLQAQNTHSWLSRERDPVQETNRLDSNVQKKTQSSDADKTVLSGTEKPLR